MNTATELEVKKDQTPSSSIPASAGDKSPIVNGSISDSPETSKYQFKIGWSYKLFLTKNSLSPSDEVGRLFRAIQKDTWKARQNELASVAIHKMNEKAVYSAKTGWQNQTTTVQRFGVPTEEKIDEAMENSRARTEKRWGQMISAKMELYNTGKL